MDLVRVQGTTRGGGPRAGASAHPAGVARQGRGCKPEPDGAVISEDPVVLKAQIKELQRQLRRAEMEKDILKKATAYFARERQ